MQRSDIEAIVKSIARPCSHRSAQQTTDELLAFIQNVHDGIKRNIRVGFQLSRLIVLNRALGLYIDEAIGLKYDALIECYEKVKSKSNIHCFAYEVLFACREGDL